MIKCMGIAAGACNDVSKKSRDAEDSVPYGGWRRNLRAATRRPYKNHTIFRCYMLFPNSTGGAGGFSRGNQLGAVSPLFPLEWPFFGYFFWPRKKSNARPARAKPCGMMPERLRGQTFSTRSNRVCPQVVGAAIGRPRVTMSPRPMLQICRGRAMRAPTKPGR